MPRPQSAERLSERNPGQVTGYAVALPDSADSGGQPIYYGGGKLAADLTLPKLRRRWHIDVTADSTTGPSDGTAALRADASVPAASTSSPGDGPSQERVREDRQRLTADERARIWEQATAAAARAAEQVRAADGGDPAVAADAAWAASDFLAGAAQVVEGHGGGPLTTAAEEYDRAARELWGRTPPPSRTGQGLRSAAVLLGSARFVARNETKQLLALLAQLAALGDAVTRLRENQDRAAQAAAARRAAEQLRLTTTERAADPARAAAIAATRGSGASFDARAAKTTPARGPVGPRHGPRR